MSSGKVALVLANLAGDVPSLCAAACVSRAWRAAAAAPALWTRLERLPPAAARRLNTERLIWLVARAAGGLERLDLSGADGVGDAGLDTALQQPHALTHFVADSDCSMLSASVVAEAHLGWHQHGTLLLKTALQPREGGRRCNAAPNANAVTWRAR